MKVVLAHRSKHGRPGDVVDLPDNQARGLVTAGHARMYGADPAPEPEPERFTDAWMEVDADPPESESVDI